MNYNEYSHGLAILTGAEECLTRSDYSLAKRVLRSLDNAARAAGANTWREAYERFRRARERFHTLPRPCRATVRTNELNCPNVSHDTVCADCRKEILRAVECYGIFYHERGSQ